MKKAFGIAQRKLKPNIHHRCELDILEGYLKKTKRVLDHGANLELCG